MAANDDELDVICRLVPGEQLVDPLWAAFGSVDTPRDIRLRAAAALAHYAPADERWKAAAGDVVSMLVTQDPISAVRWSAPLVSVQEHLVDPLGEVFSSQRDDDVGVIAAHVLAEFSDGDAETIVGCSTKASPQQLRAFANKIRSTTESSRQQIADALATSPPVDASRDELDAWAKRESNLAMLLLTLGDNDAVLERLKLAEDPRVQTYLVHRLGSFGFDHRQLMQWLDSPDASVRQSLILALAAYGDAVFTPADRQALVARLVEMHRDDPHGGVHSAVEWALRQWSFGESVSLTDEPLPKIDSRGDRDWFVTSEGHTMIVVDEPGEFWMGAPEGEPGGKEHEVYHRRVVPRSYAISSKVITVAQFRRVDGEHEHSLKTSPTDEHPINQDTWYDAARYCRWLSEQEGIAEDQMCFKPLDVLEKIAAAEPSFDNENPLYDDYLHRTVIDCRPRPSGSSLAAPARQPTGTTATTRRCYHITRGTVRSTARC